MTSGRFIIDAGTHLQFTQGAGMMVFGKVTFQGREQAPIVITRSEGVPYWAEITVFNHTNQTTSFVKHVRLSHASSPKLGLW
ncbi:hypothetical protein [Pseudoalteromonas aurantia]|uniref:Uncharacterized protein n=1 Tax=Pseudoalteromonas aurantia TaxID=43654 RepID=A0A5S3V7S0_9GAMM|nr:hypothetical protein [Pseudoalteromonas aurantia]TMO56873.1 hypothetical protein CWC18_18995 [Pseudoalteromonas aurantia]TMO67925.1 hypothetical protein CWC19_12620 [Pseudoalteromonas aurantia]TMO73798.1 hypothetical protein CWC20_12365 [Pseudoalteromonas aurantia]